VTTSSVDPAASATRGGGRRVLACCSPGGHLKQLVSLVPRLRDVAAVTWVTPDTELVRDLLEEAGRGEDRVVDVPYAAPRDLPNLARTARVAQGVLRGGGYDLAVSTGAGVAVAVLPLARLHGVRACYVESATRTNGPSLSGRILARVPGIERYSQHPGFPTGWTQVGSVHDAFTAGEDRGPRPIRRAVVTLGTIEPYGFRRLVERLVTVLPPDAEVRWQTGATDVSDLPIHGERVIPTGELEAAVRSADVVVAHAGTGTALMAFELGRHPVLVPRRHAHDEHVDDHQVETAQMLMRRGLATAVEADELTLADLEVAAGRSVARDDTPPPLEL
jgi:UDP-N-acetylglucosamine--N-acetylmuramyl-(pentapeptide) pyrophosphoryl-undecaprenol N-acetylglucosamine transferase